WWQWRCVWPELGDGRLAWICFCVWRESNWGRNAQCPELCCCRNGGSIGGYYARTFDRTVFDCRNYRWIHTHGAVDVGYVDIVSDQPIYTETFYIYEGFGRVWRFAVV